MTHDMLGIIWYFVLALVWIIYFSQELFVLGAGALHRLVSKNDDEIKQIQYATALHWDGIEVWLILGVGGLFAAFPLAYAVQLSSLYIPFFLLLYGLIARGTSIELIYKTDSKKVQTILSKTWMVSSIIVAVILGVYITNLFRGLPIDAAGSMTKSFITIFNLTGLLGGILFLAIAFAIGAAWITMTTEGDLGKRAFDIAKYTAFIFPWTLPLMYQGMNTTDNPISIQELFANTPLFYIVPAVSVLLAIGLSFTVYKKKAVPTFILGILLVVTYVASGFIGGYPYLIPSTINQSFGISLFDAMASEKTLNVMFTAALIFVPIVLAYQSFKYIRFAKKVRIGDDQ